MSDQQARRVPVGTLLHLPAQKPVRLPPSPERLQAERATGEASARAELLPRIAALERALAEAEQHHAADILATRECALRLFAGLETLMAAELADLSHAIAAAVLTTDPQSSAQALATLLSDAVRGLPRGTLRVPPEALEQARPLCPDGWALEPDDGLPANTVDAIAGPALQRQSLAGRLLALMEPQP